MSAAAAYPDFTRVHSGFRGRFKLRLILICERYVALEREPSFGAVEALMREFHSLAGTAGMVRFERLSREAAVAESVCLLMLARAEYSRPLDLTRLQQLIVAIDLSISTMS